MSIENMRLSLAGAATAAAASVWGVLHEGEGVAQNWFAAGANIPTKQTIQALEAVHRFVRTYPTAPEEALWRTLAPICGFDADAWAAQSVATRMAYVTFRRTLMLGDELIADAEREAAAAAQAQGGQIEALALSRPAHDQITGLAESPTGPREGYELKEIPNVSSEPPVASPDVPATAQTSEAGGEAGSSQAEGQPQ
jgi:hypothetical protein